MIDGGPFSSCIAGLAQSIGVTLDTTSSLFVIVCKATKVIQNGPLAFSRSLDRSFSVFVQLQISRLVVDRHILSHLWGRLVNCLLTDQSTVCIGFVPPRKNYKFSSA